MKRRATVLFALLAGLALLANCASRPASEVAEKKPEPQAPAVPPLSSLVAFDERESPAESAFLAGDFRKAFDLYHGFLTRDLNAPETEYFLARILEVVRCSGLDFSQECSELVEQIVDSSSNHALIACARLQLIRGLLRRGDTSNAAAEAAKLGFVQDWIVIGPFENEGEQGFDIAEPPEKELNQEAEYKGKQGKNRWFVPVQRPNYGIVNMAALLRETENVMAYAATFVFSPDDSEVLFRLASDGAVKLWLNNQLLHSNDVYRFCQFDQDIVHARLRKGWNYLLLKVCQKRGPWRFSVRITPPKQGATIAGLNFEPRAANLPEPWKPPQEEPRIVVPHGLPNYIAHLDATIAENPDDLASRARRALLLADRTIRDENDRFARDEMRAVCSRLAQLEKPYAPYYRLLASLEERRNGKLDALRKALSLEPSSSVLNYEMSRLYTHLPEAKESKTRRVEDEYTRQPERVSVPLEAKEKEYLEKALGGDVPGEPGAYPPGSDETGLEPADSGERASDTPTPPPGEPGLVQPHVPSLLALAELYDNRGRPWIYEARRLYQLAYSLNPNNVGVRKRLDGFAPVPAPERIKQLEDYLAADFTDSAAREELVMLYRMLGRYDDARKELLSRVLLDPYDYNAYVAIAQMMAGLDKTDEAITAVKNALAISPENHRLFDHLGHYSRQAQRTEEAKAAWEKSLAIRPNQPELEKRLRFLTSGGLQADHVREDEFWRGYEEDLKPYIEAAQRDKDDAKYGSATAVFLFKHDLVRINPNGTSRTFSQRVIKLLSEKAAREFRTVTAFPRGLDYYPQFKAEVIQARLTKPDGTVIEGTWKPDWAGAQFKQVDKGDIIVFECQLEEAGEPRYKGYFGLMLPFQIGSVNSRVANRTEKSKITLLHPKDKPIYAHEVLCAPRGASLEKGDSVMRVWELEGLSEIDEEPSMPAFYEVAPYLHLSTFQTWEEVAEWYWGVAKDQFESSEQIKEAVRAATADAKTMEERILAIYHRLVTDVRYEALRLSNHSYRPFKASHTFARRYGDCKDVSALLTVMLAEAGIEADFVLVRALDGFNGRVDISAPSMRIFNHAITFVPAREETGEVRTGECAVNEGGKGMFLDATARYYGARELPQMDQGAVAFIIKKGGQSGGSVVIPYAPPDENLIRTHTTVEVKGNGDAVVSTSTFVRGQSAGNIRATFQEGTKRKEFFEKRASRYFPGCEVKLCEFSDLTDYNKPVEYSASLTAPHMGRLEGNRLALPINIMRHVLTRAFAGLETRKHELVMAYLYKIESACEYKLPGGWRLVAPSQLPREVSYSCKGANYSMKCAFDNSKKVLTVHTELVVSEPRVLQADYPDFRKFCNDVDKLEEDEIVLEKE
jgi:tetratricopeptide (TPR) repeat protein